MTEPPPIHEERPAEVIKLVRPISVFMNVEPEYLKSVRDRSHQLAFVLWGLTRPAPQENFSQAVNDPRLQLAVARCLAAAEMCIRMTDVITMREGDEADRYFKAPY